MPKLYFYYSAMNAGKSTTLLQSSFNYHERGMKTLLFLPSICYQSSDARMLASDVIEQDSPTLSHLKFGSISCRIGLESSCILFDSEFDFYDCIEQLLLEKKLKYKCILIDEAQFLSIQQVKQLSRIVNFLGLPVLCYGLRSTYLGEPFEGSATLLTLADELTEIKTVCHCGRKATMNMRIQSLETDHVLDTGICRVGGMVGIPSTDRASRESKMAKPGAPYKVIRSGNPIDIGGNDKYVSVCMKHFYNGKAYAEF